MNGRCDTHDLACGPDGACVLCRRESLATKSALGPAIVLGPRGGPWAKPAALAGTSVAMALLVAFMVRPRGEPPVAPVPVPGAEPISTAAPPTTRPPEPSGDEPRPAEVLAARSNVQVVLYSTAWCPSCRATREWLGANGIRYTDYDVDRDPSARARWLALNPARTIPVVEVEGDVVVGFDRNRIERAVNAAARRRL